MKIRKISFFWLVLLAFPALGKAQNTQAQSVWSSNQKTKKNTKPRASRRASRSKGWWVVMTLIATATIATIIVFYKKASHENDTNQTHSKVKADDKNKTNSQVQQDILNRIRGKYEALIQQDKPSLYQIRSTKMQIQSSSSNLKGTIYYQEVNKILNKINALESKAKKRRNSNYKEVQADHIDEQTKNELETSYPSDSTQWCFTKDVYTNLFPANIGADNQENNLTDGQVRTLLQSNLSPSECQAYVGTERYTVVYGQRVSFLDFIVNVYTGNTFYLTGMQQETDREKCVTITRKLINFIYKLESKQKEELEGLIYSLKDVCQVGMLDKMQERYNIYTNQDLKGQIARIIQNQKEALLEKLMIEKFEFLEPSEQKKKENRGPKDKVHFLNSCRLGFALELGFDQTMAKMDRNANANYLRQYYYETSHRHISYEGWHGSFCKHFQDNFEQEELSKIIKKILEGINAKTSVLGAAITQKAFQTYIVKVDDIAAWGNAGLLDYDQETSSYEVKDCFVYFLLNDMGYIKKINFGRF